VPDTLPVAVNREELHGLVVPNAFEATGSFDVEITNHGTPLHVHLHLDDALSSVATLEANNHYVEEETSRLVRVTVDEPRDMEGKLKVVTAHGATTRYVDIAIWELDETEETVAVDESLSKPQPRSAAGGTSGSSTTSAPAGSTAAGGGERSAPLSVVIERPELLVLGLGGLALAVAAYAVLVLQSTVVTLGALAVLAGVLVAVFLLLG